MVEIALCVSVVAVADAVFRSLGVGINAVLYAVCRISAVAVENLAATAHILTNAACLKPVDTLFRLTF